jgi:acyl-CoA thioesterase FadM
VRVGDRLTARLVAVDAGQSAFTLGWRFERAGAVAMEARVVRAAIDPAAGRSVELPAPLRAWIESSRAKLHG